MFFLEAVRAVIYLVEIEFVFHAGAKKMHWPSASIQDSVGSVVCGGLSRRNNGDKWKNNHPRYRFQAGSSASDKIGSTDIF